MAFVASSQTIRGVRKFSIGPFKIEIVNISAASGDTAGTITAASLSQVYDCIVAGGGFKLSAQPTISGVTAVLAYADPVATVTGKAILIGV